MTRPLILVTNDDGISAPGIRTLIRIMNDYGDVIVVAPNKPQSAMGHAITIETILRCDKVVIDNGPQIEYSCNGTPADCVKLALNQFIDRKPDLCVSGINHGSNSSINVIYSGTMSAAIEASLNGVLSVGFSILDYEHNADFSEAEMYIRKVVKILLDKDFKENTCLNVNIPKKNKDIPIKGLKICRQAIANWEEEFEKRVDPKGKDYYWLKGNFVIYDKGLDTDEWALKNQYVSLVPIQFDLTDYSNISDLNYSFNE